MSEHLHGPQNILLLGASGKIGLEIRKAFAARDTRHSLICCSRGIWKGEIFPSETWLQFDPFSNQWLNLCKIDVVINAIGAIAETKEMSFERIHGGVTAAILKHRTELGNPRIVQISALGADAASPLGFLRTKGQADAVLLQEDDTIVLRPSIVCTPDTMLAQKLRKLLTIARFGLGKLLVPNGFPHTRVQPVMGADVGEAAYRAANDPLYIGVIDVVGPEKLSFGDLILRMSAAQGRKVKLIEVSREIMESFVAHFVGVWFPNLINLEQFRLLFQDNVGDAAATERLLGRAPLSTLAFWDAEATGEALEEEDLRAAAPELVTVAVE